MKNYYENLEYDTDSDYLLSVIEDYEKQGITTNVDFTLASKEKEIIESKNSLPLNEKEVLNNKEEKLTSDKEMF